MDASQNGVIPQAPILVFDDDYWMEVYESLSSAIDHLEGPTVDSDVSIAFDSLARVVRFSVQGDLVRAAIHSSEARMDLLVESMDRFSSAHAMFSPPSRLGDEREYVREIVNSYHAMRKTRRGAFARFWHRLLG